jgi:hypothetical protein
MRQEELLGAKLLALFAAYKKREAAGMIQFYEDKLMGLEDTLLQTRHQLLLLVVRCYALDVCCSHVYIGKHHVPSRRIKTNALCRVVVST